MVENIILSRKGGVINFLESFCRDFLQFYWWFWENIWYFQNWLYNEGLRYIWCIWGWDVFDRRVIHLIYFPGFVPLEHLHSPLGWRRLPFGILKSLALRLMDDGIMNSNNLWLIQMSLLNNLEHQRNPFN